MKKKWLLLILILLSFSAVFVYFQFFKPAENDKSKSKNNFNALISNIEGLILKTSKLKSEIEVSGTIMPFDETNIVSEVSGKIVQLNIPEGKFIKRGTLLIKLFDDDLQAQLKMLEVQLKIAENNEQRLKSLYNIQGTSQQEYDAGLLQVNNIKAQIEILKVNIGKTEIKAPYDGVIGLKKVSLGQYITPSTQLVTIRAINSLKLDFSIPEKFGSIMKPGAKIQFNVSGSNDIYYANVIANESSIETDSRNLNVRALISGNIKGLLPGSFAKVKANLGDNENALLIPTSAIIPQSSIKKVFVAKNGLAQSVTITTGVRQADGVEVLSGLNEGDTLIVTGILFVKPNSPIKFSKVK
jgi:membrane fusion protein (multidrug efflux system)